MALQGRPVLGIDISPTEICVVEMRGNWNDAQIMNAGSVPTPPGAVDGGRLVAAGPIAAALSSLIDSMDVTTREAVICISENSVMSRILDIPVVQDTELRDVIEGELAHYQVLVQKSGTFDFMRLVNGSSGVDAPQVLVMATDQNTVNEYNAVIDRTGLKLVALEPSLLALFRAACPDIASLPVGVCLSIGRGASEMTIVSNDLIRMSRRIDIGADALIYQRQNSSVDSSANVAPNSKGRVPFGETQQEEATPERAMPDQPRMINPSAASNLTIEVQRSLDYYTSQFPDQPAVTQIVVVTTDPALSPLAAWLSQAIPMPTVIASLPAARTSNPQVALELAEPAGLRYLGAVGLAMREMASLPEFMPRFDLSGQRLVDGIEKTSRNKTGLSLAASIILLLMGASGALMLGLRAGAVETKLANAKSALIQKQNRQEQFLSLSQTEQETLVSLKAKGFPFPKIMDAVMKAVTTNAGIVSATLDQSGKLTLTGDATSEKDAIQTRQNLTQIRFLDSISMDFMTGQPTPYDPLQKIVSFQISCMVKNIPIPAAPTSN